MLVLVLVLIGDTFSSIQLFVDSLGALDEDKQYVFLIVGSITGSNGNNTIGSSL